MSIGFEFVDQPNGGSLSYDQFAALNKLVTESGDANWSVRDPGIGKGDLEVSSWGGKQYVIDLAGNVTQIRRWTHDKAPAELVAGVNWWLSSSPAHSEDVVMVAEDGADALILSGHSNADAVAWVNPDGTVRVMKAEWRPVHFAETQED